MDKFNRMFDILGGLCQQLRQWRRSGRTAQATLIRSSERIKPHNRSPRTRRKPQRGIFRLDQQCYQYYHSQKSLRRVDQGGRVAKVPRSCSPNTKNTGPQLLAHARKTAISNGSRDAGVRVQSSRSRASCDAQTPSSSCHDVDNAHCNKIRASVNSHHSPPHEHGAPQSPAVVSAEDTLAELQQLARELGQLAFDTYVRAEQSLESWREDYHQHRHQHSSGTNPGFPDWSPDWDGQVFDTAHLAEAMRRSGVLVEAENGLDSALREAKDVGLPPIDWQRETFPDDGYGYRLSEEAAMMGSLDAVRLQNWLHGLPGDERELGGDIAIADPERNPGEYAGAHATECHNDMEMELDCEVEIGDSFSCRAEGWCRMRIGKAEAARLNAPRMDSGNDGRS